MVGTTLLTDSASGDRARRLRTLLGCAFFITLVPLVYWYIQHKSHRLAGGERVRSRRHQLLTQFNLAAYSIYALFEWSLIILDVAFDSIAVLDLNRLEVRLVDVGERPSKSAYLAPPLVGREALGSFRVEQLLSRIAAATSETRLFLSETYLGQSRA